MIVTSGVWEQGSDTAGTMTADAFAEAMPYGDKLVAVAIAFFAFSTILGWSYYGERCVERLVGAGGVIPYRMVFTCVVFVGAVTELEVVWNFADVMNGLMAIPKPHRPPGPLRPHRAGDAVLPGQRSDSDGDRRAGRRVHGGPSALRTGCRTGWVDWTPR